MRLIWGVVFNLLEKIVKLSHESGRGARKLTLAYLISIPALRSVPADKFPKIPVSLLDRE